MPVIFGTFGGDTTINHPAVDLATSFINCNGRGDAGNGAFGSAFVTGRTTTSFTIGGGAGGNYFLVIND
jgi:hypothetical protein